MAELLFVYGTLRSCFDNDWSRTLRAKGLYLGNATVRGSIYRVDHFPAYRNEPARTVYGELFEVPDDLFITLDDYEGEQFMRVPVALDDGREAWIYRYEADCPEETRIASGDFTKE